MTDDLLGPLERLTKDMREAGVTLSKREARFLVDDFYVMQENRKRADNQRDAFEGTDEPHAILDWFYRESRALEDQVHAALDVYSGNDPIGIWSRTIVGIGPVLAAGLLAHIDMEKGDTVGSIWRFAGLDPTVVWKKRQKRPWNASLKTLCWKIGGSFVYTCNKPESFYGPYYIARKEKEIANNEAGKFADQAARALKEKDYGKDTPARRAYEKGKLPDAHVHARAKRYTVKLFLSHWHDFAYRETFGKPPPNPYPMAMLGHEHYIPPPPAMQA